MAIIRNSKKVTSTQISGSTTEFENVPIFENVRTYFQNKGQPDLEVCHFFWVCEARGWKTKKGGLVKKWKSAAYEWIRQGREAPIGS